MLDRNGRLLRAYATSQGRWRLPAKVADVDPQFFDLLFAYEDKRFRSHHGVDPLALLRAAVQLVTSGRIRSGGSTLTMQVARLLEPRSDRNLSAKLRQIVRAVEIERVLSKNQILSLYLDLLLMAAILKAFVPRRWPISARSRGSSRWARPRSLVALPQSPELRRPDRFAKPRARQRPRARPFRGDGSVPADEIALAKTDRVPTARRAMPFLAPHAAIRLPPKRLPRTKYG